MTPPSRRQASRVKKWLTLALVITPAILVPLALYRALNIPLPELSQITEPAVARTYWALITLGVTAQILSTIGLFALGYDVYHNPNMNRGRRRWLVVLFFFYGFVSFHYWYTYIWTEPGRPRQSNFWMIVGTTLLNIYSFGVIGLALTRFVMNMYQH